MRTSIDEPLRFERHFVEKVWGGRCLERVPGFELPAHKRIGETWEVVDREHENSRVAEGVHRGRTLGELMSEHGAQILGSARPNRHGRFPLLVKYLDASQNLSVQVHPDENGAEALGPPAEPKTEAWYVLDADADGQLYAGLHPAVDRERFRSVVEANDVEGVVNSLERWSAKRGEVLLVKGGTVHAIGAGVRILEVQQNSDTTLRIFDWDRPGMDGKPRPVHVDEALQCAHFGVSTGGPRAPRWESVREGIQSAELARSHAFRMQGLRIRAPLDGESGGAYRIYAVLAGRGWIRFGDGRRELLTGQVWLVPACLGAHRLEPEEGGLELVCVGPGDRSPGG